MTKNIRSMLIVLYAVIFFMPIIFRFQLGMDFFLGVPLTSSFMCIFYAAMILTGITVDCYLIRRKKRNKRNQFD